MQVPTDMTWIASVHTNENDVSPVGSAIVIDSKRLLTSRHVVEHPLHGQLWVAFPYADPSNSRLFAVDCWDLPDDHSAVLADIALLHLAERTPPGVTPARLRAPGGAELVDKRWWAFGFPNGDPVGSFADGAVGSVLGHGRILLQTKSPYVIEQGFSGAGVWCEDYDSVVALVGRANSHGDGQAISILQAASYMRDAGLHELATFSPPDAGSLALEQWGWRLEEDPEARRHWRPRARGVTQDSELGHRFRGRRLALSRIVSWLNRPRPDRQVLVVTGSPGVGKSAVLGRIVVTSDRTFVNQLPPGDIGIRASVGSVGCAVHAKGKTALEVATEVARAASSAVPNDVEDMAPGLGRTLREREARRFNVVIDALDEAVTPREARRIAALVAKPLVETCADAGAQVIIGTRPRDDEGSLLAAFGAAADVIDLDDERYFDLRDLVDYAWACLRLDGHERVDNPYMDDDLARPLAARIAELSDRNFLVAGLTAREHGLHDAVPLRPEDLSITPTVRFVLGQYVDRLPAVGPVSADDALAVLGYAQAPGFPAPLWAAAVGALHGASLDDEAMTVFARSSAANFLLEESSAEQGVTFRLFHQALNEALLAARRDRAPAKDDEAKLTRAFMAVGQRINWSTPPRYLLRALPTHASKAGLVDELLADDRYLLHVDLGRLIASANEVSTEGGRRRLRLLRMTPEVAIAAPPERVALFSVTNALEQLGLPPQPLDQPGVPYVARWSTVLPRRELFTLEGHTGGVWAVTAVRCEGRTLVASGGIDGTIRLWNPATGQQQGDPIAAHEGGVWTIIPLANGGDDLLASGGADGAIRLWDPRTGGRHCESIPAHDGGVWALTAIEIDGRLLLASGGADAAIRFWDPRSRRQCLQPLVGHQGWVSTIGTVDVAGRPLIASGDVSGSVRLWDPQRGQAVGAALVGHHGLVSAVSAVNIRGRSLLASGGIDGVLRLWDPASRKAIGEPLTGQGGQDPMPGHHRGIWSVGDAEMAGRPVVISAGDDGVIRLWDPDTGRHLGEPLSGHRGVRSVCTLKLDGQLILASGGVDGVVRLWSPGDDRAATGLPAAREDQTPLPPHRRGVRSVCAVDVGGLPLLLTAGTDGAVRFWDSATGRHGIGPAQIPIDHRIGVRCVCAVEAGGDRGYGLLASGRIDGIVQLWDPLTSSNHGSPVLAHEGGVSAICSIDLGSHAVLASGGTDGALRIWDPNRGPDHAVLAPGHRGGVTTLAAVTVNGQPFLATGGLDGLIRLWDPALGTPYRRPMGGHRRGVACVCSLTVDGQVLLASGGLDGTVRLWDPATGREIGRPLPGHRAEVTAVSALPRADRPLLVSGGLDATVRIWDPMTGETVTSIPVRHMTQSLTCTPNTIVVGLTAGLLVLDIPRA